MIIKELVIRGFKSFKEKVVITIDEPIVGIVGPNGCGKSNVVDAIKWVLGEQSVKTLRGGSMEDVIYNGGAKGKSAGFAEVIIKFSTQDGKIPSKYLNFSEIEVGRRLYRSGESEYIINKTPCRLKDISDLIMGTGAGPRAYAIISQGQIGKFTTAKPKERRFFVEEAAGITKYKVRKEAAERKIQSTKQNLVRITDLISELSRQSNSLKRQADTARRYKELKEELRKLDMRLSSTTYLELKDLVSTAKEKSQELDNIVEELDTKIQSKEASLEERKTAIYDEEALLESLREKVTEAASELARVEAEIKAGNREIENLDEQVASNTESLNKYLSRAKDLENENEDIGDLSGVNEMMTEEEKKLESMKEGLQDKKERLLELSDSKEEFNSKIVNLLTEMNKARHSIDFNDENFQALKIRKGQKEREREEWITKKIESEDKVEEFGKTLEEIKDAKEQVEREKEELQEKLAKWKGELEENQSSYQVVKDELTMKNSRLISLEELRNNFDGYQDGVKSLMLDYPKKDVLQGLLGDTISVDSKYEVALESVLGDRLQGVIVERPEVGGDAISHLRVNTSGRSTFLPVNVRSMRADKGEAEVRVETFAGEAYHGYLLEKINIKDKYRGIADHLLSDIAIVDDLETAVRIWNDNKPSETMVTLAGDVLTPEGLMSGGSMEAISSGILQNKREIEELNEKIDELEVKNTLIRETIDKLEEDVEDAEEKSKNLLNFAHNEAIRIANMEKDLASSKEAFERAKQHLEVIGFEIDRFEEEERALEDKRREALVICTEKETEMSEEKEKVKAIEDEEKSLRDQIDEKQQLITETQVKYLSLKEKVDTYNASKDRVMKDIEDTKNSIHDYTQKIANADSRKEELTLEIQTLNDSLSDLVSASENSKKEQDELKEKLSGEQQAIHEADKELTELRRELSRKQGEVSKVHMQLSDSNMKLENLVNKMFESYGADIDEYAQNLLNEEGLLDDEDEIESVTSKINTLKEKVAKIEMTGVNLAAIEEYEKSSERLEFLKEQRKDLEKAISSLEKTIDKINKTSSERFENAFNAINDQFKKVFPKLFKGGSASLVLDNTDDMLTTGVDIIVQPPGKKFQNINLFSGGEQALTAISLIFSIFLINPAPFCILDEVDAPLDDSNVVRFNSIISEMSKNTQFVLITHNKRTMEVANRLYGVTMDSGEYSKLVSVKFGDELTR